MRTTLASMLITIAIVPTVAFADPWKDESGHGRGRGKGAWHGETPGWARGRGYWDGHFRYAPPPPPYHGAWYGDAWRYAPPPVEYRLYAVPPQIPYVRYEHWDWD
jgi:hypothetical protein